MSYAATRSILSIVPTGTTYKVYAGKSFIIFGSLEEANEFVERARLMGFDNDRYIAVGNQVRPYIKILFMDLGYKVSNHDRV